MLGRVCLKIAIFGSFIGNFVLNFVGNWLEFDKVSDKVSDKGPKSIALGPALGRKALLVILLAFSPMVTPASRAADVLYWNTNQNKVTADISNGSLPGLLRKIATVTGWRVFVEPGATQVVSAKFKDLAPGEALPLLLGKLNFALVPGTNSPARLFVFTTGMSQATQTIAPDRGSVTNRIPNELIVRLKPGADINALAAQLGAKVKGKIPWLNAYRLEFENESAMAAAREQLTANDQVQGVDYNYSIDRPFVPKSLGASGIPAPPQLQLKPPPADGRVIVGLIDTAVQPLGNGLDQFLLKQVSVAGKANLDPSTPSHGTSMAETVLRSLEVMTDGKTSVQILPVDVYGANPSANTFDVASGVVQAVNGGARIINLSLGSDADSQFLRDVISEVARQNVPIYAAAGNEPVATPFFPAAYPGVTAVTAIEQGQLAPYAGRGEFVSVGAPGTSLVYFNGQPYYVVGTSAATAFTSGIAAGYLDSTQQGVDQMRAFIANNFGLTVAPRPGP